MRTLAAALLLACMSACLPPSSPLSNGADATEALGKRLFFDTQLSRNRTQSCGSCHRPELSFTDRFHRAVGSTGVLHPRNTPALVDVVARTTRGWADPSPQRLEDQALVPLLDHGPIVELGFGGFEEELIARLSGDVHVVAAFEDAFACEAPKCITLPRIAMALAAFERTIQTDTSPYERALREEVALDDDAARGRDLFFSTRLRCGACHGGPRLMTPTDDGVRRVGDDGFANNGLYDVDGTGSYPARDQGVFMHSFDPKDRGLFRIPSLKNVTRTAPYFHDGSASTLDEVLDHYARGGRKIDDGPDPGDGKASPLKSPLVAGFALDDDERAALHAFFESLTDVEALDDPRFAPPSP